LFVYFFNYSEKDRVLFYYLSYNKASLCTKNYVYT